MVERTEHIGRWLSAGKLASLSIFWRDNRFDGDAAMFDVVESWRKQDKHLANWIGHGRQTNWRKEMFRQFAVQMRRSYSKIIVEEMHLPDMTRKPTVMETEKINTRWSARMAAPGELLETLVQFAGAKKHPAKNTTRKCYACGHVEAFDAASAIMHSCGGCGAVWDQDHNAAMNLLASDEAVSEPPGTLEPVAGQTVKKRITMSEWRKKANDKRSARKLDRKSSDNKGAA
jgi:hypothetical protein